MRILLGVTLVALVGCRKDLTREDLDGDGVTAADGDCAPGDAATFPEAPEICDAVDNDCDNDVDEGAGTAWYTDEDGDGFGTDEVIACAPPAGTSAQDGDCDDADAQKNPAAREACSDTDDYDCDGTPGGTDGDGDGEPACQDCDDASATTYRGAPETCNDTDDDCDGEVDEGAEDASTFYADFDGDDHGNDRFSVEACEAAPGFVTSSDDCDDLHAQSYPGAAEACDALDNDCDGQIDDGATGTSTWYLDADKDGHGDATKSQDACGQPVGHVASDDDCDDTDAAVNPAATESCTDPVDKNCDGSAGLVDGDNDGTPACTDCDDGNAAVEPGAAEACDGIDNDCDTQIDEVAPTWYADLDGDGYGGKQLTSVSCTAPGGFVATSNDCDDLAAATNPGATEACNGKDDDCSGAPGSNEVDADSDKWRGCDGDCADTDATAFPGALETCDTKDDDCDGTADDNAIDASTWYGDTDGDGVGAASKLVVACAQPASTSTVQGDCNDNNNAISPLKDEVCATVGVDDDCDGSVDESGTDGKTWYRDNDADLHGTSGQFVIACKAPTGYVALNDDCNDADALTYPGATDLPTDTIDRNCDGNTYGTGLDATSPALSCRHLKIGAPSASSGVYWLYGTPAYQAYCDMTVAGGTGWTRVVNYVNGDTTSLRTDNAVGTPGSTSNNKLSSAQVNQIVGTSPYRSLAVRVASNEYYLWDGTQKVFNWSTLNTTDAWADSACSNGAALYRSTNGNTFVPYSPSTSWAMISVCPNAYNKGAYFHFSDNTTYRIRTYIKNETEVAGYDFNNLRDSTSMWYVQPALTVGSTSAPAGTSCNAIKLAGGSLGDGLYVIQPPTQSATTVWCDMTSDPSGGWTLVTKYMNGGSGVGASLLPGADNAANMTTPAVSGKAKFADAFINAIPWTSYRIENVGDPQRQMQCDTRFTVAWDAAQGAVNGTINGHRLQWCYAAVPASGTQCMTMSDTNTYGVSPHEAGLGGHWIHTPNNATLGGFSCGFNSSAESSCSRISDYFIVRHWVK